VKSKLQNQYLCLHIYTHISQVIAFQTFYMQNLMYLVFARPWQHDPLLEHVRGLSRKYPSIFNISRTGRVALM